MTPYYAQGLVNTYVAQHPSYFILIILSSHTSYCRLFPSVSVFYVCQPSHLKVMGRFGTLFCVSQRVVFTQLQPTFQLTTGSTFSGFLMIVKRSKRNLRSTKRYFYDNSLSKYCRVPNYTTSFVIFPFHICPLIPIHFNQYQTRNLENVIEAYKPYM